VITLICHLSQVFVNARLFLMYGALDDLIYLMLMGSTDQVQTQAAHCISKVIPLKYINCCTGSPISISANIDKKLF